ncbi:MAG: cytochrome c [Actinomycetia bacterium]|nr:cytochrome c [Actinomycetes bacterium]
MDELLQQVAEMRGMPASLVERSAQARADKTGSTIEQVLQEWLGEGSTSASKPEVTTAPVAEPEPPVTPDTPALATASVPTGVTTDELVQLASEAKRMPPKLILSSAQARATHAGETLDSVLADWAGIDLDELVSARTPAPVASGEPDVVKEDEPPAEPEEATPAPVATAAAAAVAVGAMSMDELLTQVAEVKGMPASLAQRSAEARSKKTGESVEAVLAEWAGVDPGAATEPPVEPDAVAPAPVAAAAAVAVGAMSMDELLAQVAEVKGMPASLAQRSAEARSKKTGESVEAVLAEWAGVDPGAVSTAPPSAPEPATEDTSGPSDEEPDPNTGDDVEVIEPTTDRAQGPTGDEADEAAPAQGGYPKWLLAAFLLIPLLAVGYILVSPNGPDCGSGGQLLVDPATGEAVNCDGSPYGETTADYFASGGAIYAQCVACHNADGTGGVGPAFTAGAVLETFPAGQCATQIEWVGIGTAGWPDPTYGENQKPVGGVGLMPGFAASLSEEQLAAVSLYERVQFGGQDLVDAEIDCGLVEASNEG